MAAAARNPGPSLSSHLGAGCSKGAEKPAGHRQQVTTERKAFQGRIPQTQITEHGAPGPGGPRNAGRPGCGEVKQISSQRDFSEPVISLHTAGAASCKRGQGWGSEFPACLAATQSCGQSISPGNGVPGNIVEKPWYKALVLPVPVSSGWRAGGSDGSEAIAWSTLCPVPAPNKSADNVWGSAGHWPWLATPHASSESYLAGPRSPARDLGSRTGRVHVLIQAADSTSSHGSDWGR